MQLKDIFHCLETGLSVLYLKDNLIKKGVIFSVEKIRNSSKYCANFESDKYIYIEKIFYPDDKKAIELAQLTKELEKKEEEVKILQGKIKKLYQ